MEQNSNYGGIPPRPYYDVPNERPVRQTIIVKQNASNGVGTAGFVFSLITLFLGWIPILGWVLWFLGALLSFIGIFKSPRGLAISGLIISFIDVILLVVLAGIIAAGLGMA